MSVFGGGGRTKQQARQGLNSDNSKRFKHDSDEELTDQYEMDVNESEPEPSENDSYYSDESYKKTKKPKKMQPEDKSQFKNKVNGILQQLNNTDKDFAVSGSLLQAPIMLISIKGGGILRFPMYENDTENVIKVFEKSPYGRGTKTVLDPSFRNSWQLNPSGFKILNPKWESYMKEVLLPRIGQDMGIDPTTFTASLYKLLLYKTGSFFKIHRDSEKEARMFGTLVVQLPSKYTGGQLVVTHDGKIKTIDSSCSTDSNNEYEMFYSAFYCDLQHEVLALTSGVRVCLIYNLALTKTNLAIPVAPLLGGIQDQLAALLKDWDISKGPTKIVYVLSHKYTQRNFSFENLKASDKTVAQTMLNLSKQNNLTVLTGIFEKQSSGNSMGEGYSDFDSEDEDCHCENEYSLKHLKLLDTQKSKAYQPDFLTVDYEEEVIPVNCFLNDTPYHKALEETGNEGTNVSLFYRGAAFVIFPPENEIGRIGTLIRSNKISAAEQMFLKEFEKIRKNKKPSKSDEEKLKKWATVFSTKTKKEQEGNSERFSRQLNNVVAMLSAIISFNDLKLLQNFLDLYQPINETTIPLIVSQCEKFGWSSLSPQLLMLFKTFVKKSRTALKLLNMVVGEEKLKKEKEAVCRQLAQVVLELEKRARSNQYSYSYYGGRTFKTLAEQKSELESEQKFLYGFCKIAKVVKFNSVLEFAKEQPMSVVVPVLIKLSNQLNHTLDSYWFELGRPFLEKMEAIVAKSAAPQNWKFNNYLSCGCADCVPVQGFMLSDITSAGFKMGEKRRKHIEKILKSMGNIRSENQRVGNSGTYTLVISKMSTTNEDEAEEQKLAKELLPKLKAMIPT